jgi:hypothetical protein
VEGWTAGTDCMPSIPPDPLYLDFVLGFDNTAGSQAVNGQLLGASLVGSAGSTSFLVTPLTTGAVAPGAYEEFYFSKVPNSAKGTPGCNWCGASQITLHVDVEVGGSPHPVSTPLDGVGCAY